MVLSSTILPCLTPEDCVFWALERQRSWYKEEPPIPVAGQLKVSASDFTLCNKDICGVFDSLHLHHKHTDTLQNSGAGHLTGQDNADHL